MIVKVLLTLRINQLFSYRIKKNSLIKRIRIGQLVKVDFKNKKYYGIIFSFDKKPFKGIKYVEEIYFDIVLKKEFLEALNIFSNYSCNTFGSLLKLSLAGFNKRTYYKLKNSIPNARKQIRAMCSKDLNLEQQNAVKEIKIGNLKSFKTILLDGVTGSGKTRVYTKIIQEALEKSFQCLVLVPEIILTSQWISEFKDEFGFEPEIYHSSISSTKKSAIWINIALGELKLVVGTRSALFLPFNNLGLIILDEEHDSSYKQEDGVIINSRDWAVLLAKKSNCKIILSTATPSIETLYNCHIKKYTKVSLTKRFNNTKLPEIEIVDMKKNALDKNKWISNPLKEALKTCFNSGKQSLLFLNKRGYAPVVICTKCGYSISCPNCDFALVLHKNKHINSDHVLICHHCNYLEKFNEICPKCKSKNCLTNAGPGIEKIYEEVSDLFPREEICLLSSDTVKNKNNLKKIINSIQNKEIKIIIGTQIIAKGHHFPNLETVGIINIDNLINSLDFRSCERAYQLITQVAGRSGRESSAGRVLVQTYHPESNIIEMCSSYQKENFYKWELKKRKKYRLPPFVNLISIIIENNNPSIAKKHAYETISLLKVNLESRVFGPTPAPIFKLRNKYRYRILIKFEKSSIHKQEIRERLMKIIFNKGTKIKVDVDPYNFL